jgi:hypothetical protein
MSGTIPVLFKVSAKYYVVMYIRAWDQGHMCVFVPHDRTLCKQKSKGQLLISTPLVNVPFIPTV